MNTTYIVTYYHRSDNEWKGPFRYFSREGAQKCADFHAKRAEVGQVEVWEDLSPDREDVPQVVVWSSS